MTNKTISPLRQRMIEDMTVRRFTAKTQSDYIPHVKNFSLFLGRSPHTATPEDLRAFQVHQSAAGVQPPTMNSTVSALRFFFTTTLDRPEMARHLALVPQPLHELLAVEVVPRGERVAAPGEDGVADRLACAHDGAQLQAEPVARRRVRLHHHLECGGEQEGIGDMVFFKQMKRGIG